MKNKDTTKSIALAFLLVLASSVAIPQVVFCQGQDALPAEAGSNLLPKAEPDQTMFYAFLDEDPQALGGPLIEYLREKPVFRDWLSPQDKLDRRFRPLLQWRRWADKKQHFVPALLFMNLVAFLSWSLIPNLLQAAAQESRKSYWKCFGSGLILAAVCMLITRSAFLTQLGWPLGILLSGLAQAAMLLGLSVAVFNLGHSTSLLLQLHKIEALKTHADRMRCCDIVVGTVIAALLLQIPPIGAAPQAGTRLVALFSLLGVGAIFRELKRRRENN